MADDLGALYTDRQLIDMERKLSRLYTQAGKDIERKLADFTAKMAAKEKVFAQQVKDGKMTQKAFDDWKAGVAFRGKQWTDKMSQISAVLADTNIVATNILRDKQIGVFAMNGNYAAYTFEHGFGVSFGFDLYDEKTVARLLADDPNILPFKKLDKKKDTRWNFKNIRTQITQGIIQGESIPQIAKRLAGVVPDRNKKQMTLHARTAMTSAQNGGRQERYKEAEELGIKFKKVWLATLDGRTRDTHADLDGQAVKPNESFKVAGYTIRFPGDPWARPELVYNCRCTLVTELDDYPSSFNRRVQEDGSIIADQSFREWEKSKQKEENASQRGNSFIESLIGRELSPYIGAYHNVQDYWQAKREWQGEQTKYLDDIYEYQKLETHAAWISGENYSDKIPRIESTIASLNEQYPMTATGDREYTTKLNELVVCDYSRAWEYLPDGQNDRRLSHESDAAAQVFINPRDDHTGSVIIAFNRPYLTDSIEKVIAERDSAIQSKSVLSSIGGGNAEMTVVHEWGHVMSEHLDHAMVYQDETVIEYWNWYRTLSKDEIRNGLSDYATTNRGEFEAECFAELQMPNPRPLALKFKEYLDEVIKKGY